MELPEEVKLFLLESYENLDLAEQELLELERSPGDPERINRIFRGIHTIKGNCGFLAFRSLETICHRGETLLDRLRSKQLSFDAEIGSLLLEFIDVVRTNLSVIETSGADGGGSASELLARLDAKLTT